MTSQAKVNANRRNPEQSTGPRTTQGKAVVARNAIKHGLLARQDIVMGEDPQEFELLRHRLLADLEPCGDTETLCVQQIASLWWRLARKQGPADSVCSVPVRAYKETPYGVTTNGTDSVKQSQWSCRTDSPRETKPMEIAEAECAKQSQSAAAGGRGEAAGSDKPSCETKPTEATGSVCSVPVRASKEVSSLKSQVSSREGQASSLQTSHFRLDSHDEPPCGVTTSGADRVKQSQSPVEEQLRQ